MGDNLSADAMDANSPPRGDVIAAGIQDLERGVVSVPALRQFMRALGEGRRVRDARVPGRWRFEPRLYRFPAVDAASFGAAVREAFGAEEG